MLFFYIKIVGVFYTPTKVIEPIKILDMNTMQIGEFIENILNNKDN